MKVANRFHRIIKYCCWCFLTHSFSLADKCLNGKFRAHIWKSSTSLTVCLTQCLPSLAALSRWRRPQWSRGPRGCWCRTGPQSPVLQVGTYRHCIHNQPSSYCTMYKGHIFHMPVYPLTNMSQSDLACFWWLYLFDKYQNKSGESCKCIYIFCSKSAI